MIKNRLAVIMAENRTRNLSSISQETGISRTTLTSLYSNQENAITYRTIETLCKHFKIKFTEFFEEVEL